MSWCRSILGPNCPDTSAPVPKCLLETSALMPKCLGTEVSWVRSVRLPLGLWLVFVIFRSTKSEDLYIRILPWCKVSWVRNVTGPSVCTLYKPSTDHKCNWPKAVKKLLWLLQIVTKFRNYFALIIIHIDCVCHVGDGHWLLMWQLPGLEFWSSLLRPCRRRVDIASAASADRRHVYVTHWRRFRGRTVQNRFTKC